ncbi:MAG: MlrC C-terminal domain-containing protein, partial [Pseudomonadota bacterium]
VPIALTLDLHGNVSARMAALSDILIGYRTYPHLDMYAIAREACAMLDAAMAGRRAFRTVVRQPATLLGADLGRTTAPGNAMERLLAAARAAEAAAEVDAVTIFGGFPWADIPDAGPCVTVTGARDAPGLEAVADAIAAEIWETRAETSVVPLTIAEAVAKAKAGEGSGRPLVIADMTDNPGMGGYGDHVGLLRAMVEAGLEGALFAKCADPEAAAAAVAAGEGAEVTLSLGSRTDPALYGPPFETTALVERVIDGAYVNEGPMFAGLPLSLGPSALLRMGGVRAIVATNTLQVMDLNMPRAFGLAPETLDTIVVKSAQHFRAAFAPIAREIVLADSGALASPDLTRFPFSKLRRPIWPLDA